MSNLTHDGAKFIVETEEEAIKVVTDAIKNGVKNVLDNKKTGEFGQKTFQVFVEASDIIGTKGEKKIKIVVDELGNIWSIYPVK